ncbi:MAG: hypothetical protein KDK26_19170 [Roseivivax sp.]|nr:hypothetical protein [Roseivivax sp.]
MTPEAITEMFGGAHYRFARWARPMAPVVFGVDDTTLATIRGAFDALTRLTGQPLAETDPELGANVMIFAFRDWAELRSVPNLDRMIDGMTPLLDRLEAENASHYRMMRLDETGAIRAAFVFLRMSGPLADVPAADLALDLAVQVALLWSDTAFANRSPLAVLEGGHVVLRPEIGALIRAAYDPVLPDTASDAAHALRLAARMG